MLKTTFVTVLLFSATAAAAQTLAPVADVPVAAPSANSTNAAKKPGSDRIVCREEETIGTRLGGRKLCMTVAQWQQREQDARLQTEHLQSNIGIVSH